MVLLVDKPDHEMIWLPYGDEIPDREKHMIQSPKLIRTFAWNPHRFQVVDVIPFHAKRRDVHGRLLSPKYSHRDRCSVWSRERGERRLVVHADNAGPHTAKVTRAFCDSNFIRSTPDPSYLPDWAPSRLFLFSCLGISKTASKSSNPGLQMNFFRESEKFWTNSAFTLWKRFSGRRSTNWTGALQPWSKWKACGIK
jgi:hypothetical protein